MPKAQKTAEKGRYFFSTKGDLTLWIEENAQKTGLRPPEFIRMKMHEAMMAEDDRTA